MEEIIMTPEQEFNETYPHEMEEWPYEVKFKVRGRRSAKEIIKDILRIVGNVLLYGLIGVAVIAVFMLAISFFNKHPEALKIVGYVLLGAVCIGALMGLGYGLIQFYRWLTYGWIKFCRWIKDLKENREKRRNLMRKIGKVLLYGLIGTVGLVVLGLIVVFFSKHLEALKIVGYVLLGAVCIGAVMALVYGLICLCRWLVDGMISFYGWIKDLKENGGRKRRRGPVSREEYRTMLWNEKHTYHHPQLHKKYGRKAYRHPYELAYRTSLEEPHCFVE